MRIIRDAARFSRVGINFCRADELLGTFDMTFFRLLLTLIMLSLLDIMPIIIQ